MTFLNAVFDLDGTLADSMATWRNNELDALEAVTGIRITPEDREVLSVNTFNDAIRKAAEKYGVEHYDFAAVTKEAHRLMTVSYREDDMPLKPYVKEFLAYIRSRGGKTAVATATPRVMVMPYLERMGVIPLLDAVLSVHEEKCDSKGKSAEIFERAMNAIGGTKENTVVFEDAYHAIVNAKKAGFTVYAVPDAKQANAKEISRIADRFLTSFADVMED